MLRTSSYFAVVAACFAAPRSIDAQPSPPDTVHRIAALHETLVRSGRALGPRVWPGFRPDTIPTLYVIPRRAKLLAQWRDTLPTGFFPLPGRAATAWTDTRTVSFPTDRPIAFLRVDSGASPGSVLGLALHEAFHELQQASARRGRRFGAGENSVLVATYPVYDVENEAAFALEGRLLGRALRAGSLDAARRAAREFLAVRERRQARLDAAVAEFERAAELNEGLAQYATLRGLRVLARVDAGRFERAARAEAAQEAALLDSLLVVGPRSIRRRFYATGSAIALVLDRLADSAWKERLVRNDGTLQQSLAEASGYRGREALGIAWGRRTEAELSDLRAEAARAAASLEAVRRAQRDSVLATPGLQVVIDPSGLPGGRLAWCGFDPQNVLQTAAGELLHMRMLRLCGGAGVEIQLDQPVVEHRAMGLVRAAVGDPSAIRLTASGGEASLPSEGTTKEMSGLRIEGPTFTLTVPRATLTRRGNELWIVPRAAQP
jgi:hypothetical protein